MPRIQVFASSEAAFFVNSFILETARGLVLVDTQFLKSSGRDLCEAIRARSRPLLAVVITHPHPDHFNGMLEIDRAWPGLPIHATQATMDTIAASEAAKRAAWTPVYKEDYPEATVMPNRVVLSGQGFSVDGLDIVVDDLGAGESADITVVHLPQRNALIASDLLYHRVHPWLAEGRTAAWIDQLELVRQRYAGVEAVYAGHGETADLDALAEQADYLRAFRQIVRQHVADLNQPQPDEKRRIVEMVKARYAGYPLEMLIPLNVDGVAKELAAEALASP